MYKKLENYSINHETEIDFHEFNNRILRTIENLSITEIVSNDYLYEVDQKTNKGVRVTYFFQKELKFQFFLQVVSMIINWQIF